MKKILIGSLYQANFLFVSGIAIFCLIFTPQAAFSQILSPVSSQFGQVPLVTAIEVRGNEAISLSTILSRIKIRVGEEYRQTVISDDLKRLYNTGYFSDVRVDREDYKEGLKVIIYVEEKPIVEKITFSRIRYLKSRAIQKKMKIKEGKFLDNKFLRDDILTIKDMYLQKGLTDVTVDVEKNFIGDNKVALHFVIREGGRLKVKRINIEGNDSFSYKKILKVMKSRPDGIFRNGYLKEDVLDEDMLRIVSFYEKEGFINAQAEYTIEDTKPGRLEINVAIEEGQQYFVGDILIIGNEIVSEERILEAMKDIKVGSVFSREKLSIDARNIQTLYFDKGYIFARVSEATALNPDSGKVEISLDIEEGGIAYVNKVRVEGNTQTRDIVIRREIRLYPGDQFDGEKLRRTKERLRRLGYFEDIGYNLEDTDSPDKKDLVIQVKEAKTGSFSFGGGFSTVDKIIGFVEVEQRNFDFTNWPTFTGGGQQLSIRAEVGSIRSNRRLSFTEPWIFDYPVSGGFDAFQTEREREDDIGFAYDEERVGGTIRFGKQFSEYVTGRAFYTMEVIDISDVESDASADLAAEAGENTVSTLGFSIDQDKRDSALSPTQGLFLGGNFDVAGGFLGGDKDFYRILTESNYYIPLKYKSVLEFRLKAGIVDAYGDSDRVPIFERFFAGGAKSIRGYEERNVGPVDPLSDDPIGGESLLVANIEYTIPVIDFIKIAGFFDTGNVWSDVGDIGSGSFKSGFGLGLRVKTPIGPVSLDYGIPINDPPGEDDSGRGRFYFSASRGF